MRPPLPRGRELVRVEGVAHRRIVVDGQEFNEDVVVTQWGWVEPRRARGRVTLRELEGLLLHHGARVLVLGRGLVGLRELSAEDEEAIARMGVRLVSLPTPEAAAEFGRLAEEEEGVLGLFRVVV